MPSQDKWKRLRKSKRKTGRDRNIFSCTLPVFYGLLLFVIVHTMGVNNNYSSLSSRTSASMASSMVVMPSSSDTTCSWAAGVMET